MERSLDQGIVRRHHAQSRLRRIGAGIVVHVDRILAVLRRSYHHLDIGRVFQIPAFHQVVQGNLVFQLLKIAVTNAAVRAAVVVQHQLFRVGVHTVGVKMGQPPLHIVQIVQVHPSPGSADKSGGDDAVDPFLQVHLKGNRSRRYPIPSRIEAEVRRVHIGPLAVIDYNRRGILLAAAAHHGADADLVGSIRRGADLILHIGGRHPIPSVGLDVLQGLAAGGAAAQHAASAAALPGVELVVVVAVFRLQAVHRLGRQTAVHLQIILIAIGPFRPRVQNILEHAGAGDAVNPLNQLDGNRRFAVRVSCRFIEMEHRVIGVAAVDHHHGGIVALRRICAHYRSYTERIGAGSGGLYPVFHIGGFGVVQAVGLNVRRCLDAGDAIAHGSAVVVQLAVHIQRGVPLRLHADRRGNRGQAVVQIQIVHVAIGPRHAGIQHVLGDGGAANDVAAFHQADPYRTGRAVTRIAGGRIKTKVCPIDTARTAVVDHYGCGIGIQRTRRPQDSAYRNRILAVLRRIHAVFCIGGGRLVDAVFFYVRNGLGGVPAAAQLTAIHAVQVGHGVVDRPHTRDGSGRQAAVNLQIILIAIGPSCAGIQNVFEYSGAGDPVLSFLKPDGHSGFPHGPGIGFIVMECSRIHVAAFAVIDHHRRGIVGNRVSGSHDGPDTHGVFPGGRGADCILRIGGLALVQATGLNLRQGLAHIHPHAAADHFSRTAVFKVAVQIQRGVGFRFHAFHGRGGIRLQPEQRRGSQENRNR